MNEIYNILSDTSHRPYELPVGQWRYYQEWNKALFLHWVVPFEILRKCVPERLHIDSFDGLCYVSLVAFTMQKIRPRLFPAIKFISDFHEINLRTYIENDDKKGVYFLNIEAEKHLSAFVARKLSGLPYEKAIIQRSDKRYNSKNAIKNFALEAEFEIREKIVRKSALDKWLTERYCLYVDLKEKIVRFDIHHREWELQNVVIKHLEPGYKIADYDLSDKLPDLAHYSNGVKVLAWDSVADW
jgi:uncharacterized protein YqjF (DUF2071 family)